jgi:hypothetical protein
VPGEIFATADKALDERTIGHNPERINLMKVEQGGGGVSAHHPRDSILFVHVSRYCDPIHR